MIIKNNYKTQLAPEGRKENPSNWSSLDLSWNHFFLKKKQKLHCTPRLSRTLKGLRNARERNNKTIWKPFRSKHKTWARRSEARDWVIRASAAWGRPRDRSTTIALAPYLSLFNPTHPCIRVFADNRLYLYVRGRAIDLPPWHSRLTGLYSIPRTPVYMLYIIGMCYTYCAY